MDSNQLTFVIATGNEHKYQEFLQINSSKCLNIIRKSNGPEVDETGSNYSENAFLKAQEYAKHFKCPAFADDSGLEIEALPHILGLHSARYLEGSSYKEKCKVILDQLKEVRNRAACFKCSLCFYLSPQEYYFFEGEMRGQISTELGSEGGFGYDPIFIPNAYETKRIPLSQLEEWKDENSHRSIAFQKAVIFFEKRFAKNS